MMAWRHIVLAVFCGLAMVPLRAQQMNISLHQTAVPDSFEVRAVSTAGILNGLFYGRFTVRWEITSGGVMDINDIQEGCEDYNWTNYGGMVDLLDHRYYTINIEPKWPLTGNCGIGTSPVSMGGFRIRELSGCRNVELVHGGFTTVNNLSYWMEIGGMDVTGMITSGPITEGNCPCVPPEIVSINASDVPECLSWPLDLSVIATGTALSYTWWEPGASEPFHYLPSFTVPMNPLASVPNIVEGHYMVEVSNVCGVDTGVIEVLPDPSFCIPPTITSASFSGELPCLTPTYTFQGTAEGSCLLYQWVKPDGSILGTAGSPGVSTGDADILGQYILRVWNDCGIDSIQVGIDTTGIGPCVPPEIIALNAGTYCPGAPLTINSQVNENGPCVEYEWSGLGSSPNDGSPNAIINNPSGTYTLTVSNVCGSAAMSIAPDTTGLGECTIPVIHSITTNGPICAGDTVILTADVEVSGPCPAYQWSGANVVQSYSAATQAPNGAGNYTLVVTNGCGSTSLTVPSQVVNMTNVTRTLCSPVGPIDLDSLINTDPSIGYWMHNDLPHSGIFDPAIDVAGTYYKHNDLGCAIRRLYLIVGVDVHAGVDAELTVCSTDDPVDLFPLLGEDVTEGGFWFVGMSPLPDGFYYPQNYSSGNFGYQINGDGCGDQAFVTVTELQATPWYTDQDGDGFGDPAETIMDCDQPDGAVADASDDCPLLFGLIGDACDDGLPTTINDVIASDCECEGDLITSINELGEGDLIIWPNPNRGDLLFLQNAPISFLLLITDQSGRYVTQRTITGSTDPVTIEFEVPLASGSYVVHVVSDDNVWIGHLLIER